MEEKHLQRLNDLENRYNRIKKFYVGMLLLLCGVIVSLAFTRVKTSSDIIRTKGIIIEDENGKDRILIGSPIPYSPNRVRTDTGLVKKYWASHLMPNNPNKYMEFYKDYYHSTNGMVVMNEDGFDRILIGDELADSNIGHRNYEAAGITWNDNLGYELGGAGVNTSEDGSTRSVIGLDDKNGEAIHLVILEDGTKALIIGGKNGRLMIGMSDKENSWFQNTNEFVGIKYFNNNGNVLWEKEMNNN